MEAGDSPEWAAMILSAPWLAADISRRCIPFTRAIEIARCHEATEIVCAASKKPAARLFFCGEETSSIAILRPALEVVDLRRRSDRSRSSGGAHGAEDARPSTHPAPARATKPVTMLWRAKRRAVIHGAPRDDRIARRRPAPWRASRVFRMFFVLNQCHQRRDVPDRDAGLGIAEGKAPVWTTPRAARDISISPRLR